MPGNGRYRAGLGERAVRMVLDNERCYGSQWEAICSVADKLGPISDRIQSAWVSSRSSASSSSSSYGGMGRRGVDCAADGVGPEVRAATRADRPRRAVRPAASGSAIGTFCGTAQERCDTSGYCAGTTPRAEPQLRALNGRQGVMS